MQLAIRQAMEVVDAYSALTGYISIEAKTQYDHAEVRAGDYCTKQCYTIPYNAIPYNTIQYYTIL